jgi:hypothetical protein
VYKKERPIILSIIAILEMLAGALVLLMGGLFLILSMGVLGEDFASAWETTFANTFGPIFSILAVGILFVGFLIFILGYGLWKLNYGAWIISVFLYGLSTISMLLRYDRNYQLGIHAYLLAIQTGNFSVLLSPVITIGLFIYLITIKDRFIKDRFN